MDIQNSQINNDEPPKKNWFSAHHLLGYIFLFAVLAAGVSIVYYWQTVRSIPKVYEPIVHKDPTANWKTYMNEQYGFEFKYPNDWLIEQSNGEWHLVSVEGQQGKQAYEEYMKGPPKGDCCPPYYDFSLTIGKQRPNPDNIQVNNQKEFINQNGIRLIQYDEIGSLYGGLFYSTESKGNIYNFEVIQGEENILRQILSTFKFIEQPAETTLKKAKEDQRYVYYEGSITVSGSFQEILYPTIFGGTLCFYPDDKTSYLIPRENDDVNRLAWFCFDDQDKTKAALGVYDKNIVDVKCKMIIGEATIVVSNYIVDKAESEVSDTAKLISIIVNNGAKVIISQYPGCEQF